MEETSNITMELEVSKDFQLEKAICNHGYFMMAPNKWLPETKTLQRPIRLHQNSYESLLISISQPSDLPLLLIRIHTKSITSSDCYTILGQVRRMLRLSEKAEKDIREFQEIHEEAKEKGFGRLFRSVSLFEDLVKSILLCNCSWNRTLEMAAALCENQPYLACMLQNRMDNLKTQGKKRKRETNESRSSIKIEQKNDVAECGYGAPLISLENFPTPEELSMVDEDYLKSHCKLGHRAKTILSLVRKIENGKLKLGEEIDEQGINKIKKCKGIGEFTFSNILMCVGFYNQIPIDSETVRLVKKVHGKEDCSSKNIRKYVKQIYGKYEPFQCLAYWMELLNDYESKVGKLSELPSSSYHTVNGRIDKNAN